MGKPWENGDLYGKSPFIMGKSTVFHSLSLSFSLSLSLCLSISISIDNIWIKHNNSLIRNVQISSLITNMVNVGKTTHDNSLFWNSYPYIHQSPSEVAT